MEPFDLLCQKLSANIPKLVIYGEARAIVKKEGVSFVNQKNEPCSVHDGYNCVLFWVKSGSEPDGTGFGKNSAKRAINSYTLAVNSKENQHDMVRAVINSLKDFVYSGSNFDTLNIADQYFGLTQANFETHFFSIDFTVTENINPVVCVDC